MLFIILSSVPALAAFSSITPSAPGNDTWTADTTPDFSFTAVSDVNATFSCELFVGGTSEGVNATTGNDTLTTLTAAPALSQGTVQWYVTCTDNDTTASSVNWTLIVDTTVPGASIATTDGWTTDTTPQIAFTLTDNLDTELNYTFFVDDTADVVGYATDSVQAYANLTALGQGNHTILVEAEDGAGNKQNSSGITLTVDSSLPTSTINSPGDGNTTTDTTPDLNFTLTDNLDTVIDYTIFVDNVTDGSGTAANATPTVVTLSAIGIGSHALIVEAEDEAGNLQNSSIVTITIAAASSPPETGGGGSSGDRERFRNVDAGEQVEMRLRSSSTGVQTIMLRLSHGVPSFVVEVDRERENPTSHEPSGNVYRYLSIDPGLAEGKVEDGIITFRIERRWLSENYIDYEDVALFRFADGWSALPTTLLEVGNSFVTYEAETPGFSYFAIGEEESPEPVIEPEQTAPVAAPEPVPVVTPEPESAPVAEPVAAPEHAPEPAQEPEQEPAPEPETGGFPWLAVLIVAIVVILVIFFATRKRE